MDNYENVLYHNQNFLVDLLHKIYWISKTSCWIFSKKSVARWSVRIFLTNYQKKIQSPNHDDYGSFKVDVGFLYKVRSLGNSMEQKLNWIELPITSNKAFRFWVSYYWISSKLESNSPPFSFKLVPTTSKPDYPQILWRNRALKV